MPPKNKKLKQFALVQRSTYDTLRHDENKPKGVFVELTNLNDRELKNFKKPKAISMNELEKLQEDFKSAGRRDNEGEAALYGITFDDSKYDYMQHLRPIGTHKGAYFIGTDGKVRDSYKPSKVGDRMTLHELLNDGKSTEEAPMTFREHYQAQLPLQDVLSGLQPNMDPRLREVLEALEDEEYIENDDDADFAELVRTGEVRSEAEWRDLAEHEEPEDMVQRQDEEEWEFAFRKFKLENKKDDDVDDVDSADLGASDFGSELGSDGEERDTLGALKWPVGGAAAQAADKRKKKKKMRIGAKTDLSGYSMSSSANYRNEGLTLLDDSFEKVEEDYAKPDEEDADDGQPFDMNNERPDLNDIMDEFLDNYVVEGKHLYKVKK